MDATALRAIQLHRPCDPRYTLRGMCEGVANGNVCLRFVPAQSPLRSPLNDRGCGAWWGRGRGPWHEVSDLSIQGLLTRQAPWQ